MKSIKITNKEVKNMAKIMNKLVLKNNTSFFKRGMNINTETGSLTVTNGNILISVENISEIKDIDIFDIWKVDTKEQLVEAEITKTSVYLTALDSFQYPDYKSIFNKTKNITPITCKLYEKSDIRFSIFYSKIISQSVLNAGKENCFNIEYLKILYDLLTLNNAYEYTLKVSDNVNNLIYIESQINEKYTIKTTLMPIILDN